MNTPQVFNQTPPLVDIDLTTTNRPLLDALAANGVDLDAEGLASFGERWGTAHRLDLGRLANENPPRLRTYDPTGHRLDVVEFHPAYHALMAASMEDGLHASTWDAKIAGDGASRRSVARAARRDDRVGRGSGACLSAHHDACVGRGACGEPPAARANGCRRSSRGNTIPASSRSGKRPP